MANSVRSDVLDLVLLVRHLLGQEVSMADIDHLIQAAMHDQNPLATDAISNLLELLRRLVMPSGGDKLAEEAALRVALRVSTLVDLHGGIVVAVGRKETFLVGSFKPR